MAEQAERSTEESVYDKVKSAPFQPLQPEAVQPTSSPTPSSTAPESDGDTSGEDGEAAPVEQAQAAEAPLPEFDPKYREPLTGLLYLGALTETFTLWGHEFVIRTLTTEQMTEAALYTAKYEGTRAANSAYAAATLANAVVSVDGNPLPQGLGGNDTGFDARVAYVTKNWYPAVRDAIWAKVFSLEEKAREVLEALGKASG